MYEEVKLGFVTLAPGINVCTYVITTRTYVISVRTYFPYGSLPYVRGPAIASLIRAAPLNYVQNALNVIVLSTRHVVLIFEIFAENGKY